MFFFVILEYKNILYVCIVLESSRSKIIMKENETERLGLTHSVCFLIFGFMWESNKNIRIIFAHQIKLN